MKKKTTSKVTGSATQDVLDHIATKKVTSAVTASEPVSVPTTLVKPEIAKLVPFGNEDMHKVVAKINEIIDAL